MKINVTVDLEEWGSDEAPMSDRIIQPIANAIIQERDYDFSNVVKRAVESAMTAKVDAKLEEMVNDRFTRGIPQVDTWGEPTGKSTSFGEMMSKRMEVYLNERVNDRGEAQTGYNSSKEYPTRLEQVVKQAAKQTIDAVTSETRTKITEQFNAEMKARLVMDLTQAVLKSITIK